MTDQKPTGVFVRLPLSDEQHDTLYHTTRTSGDEVALCAIGTQVPGAGLTCIGNIVWFENDREPVLGSYVPAVFKQGSGVPVASLHEAQAQIAARDAEIVRLQRVLNAIRDDCHDLPEFMRLEAIIKTVELALKGGAA